MKTHEIRQKYLEFFREKGHAIIPSASLIPENDPTVLFTTAGMHPLVPYLLGEVHPAGKRLASAQKCMRTDDIDEVGDNRHGTFFEMLGNWSLGDYFKREAIAWSFELLTDARWFGMDASKLYVTVFEGDADAPRDEESIGIWQAQFEMKGIAADVGVAGMDEPTITEQGPRIFAYPKKKNWWGPAGQTGPCGPDTEMFYDTGLPHDTAFGEKCHPNCDCGRFIEIWNDVFMQYDKQTDGAFLPLKQQNVDTGMGLERMAKVLQGVPTIFDTDALQGIMHTIAEVSGKAYNAGDQRVDRSFRIVADHVRSATFVMGDPRGVVPSNVGQGYIVRRLVRRAIREGRRLGVTGPLLEQVALAVIGAYGEAYPELETNAARVLMELKKEEEKFGKSVEKGTRELEKMMAKTNSITGEQAFVLFSTFGFPVEMTEEIVKEQGGTVDHEAFVTEFKKHQDLSRTASAGVFKGGLADSTEETTQLHTATHLLQAALRKVLGTHVEQRGSNITVERLRFDFSHPDKMTPEQVQTVEELVNSAIRQDLPVTLQEMTVAEAKTLGAMGLFDEKYGDKVKVYTVGDPLAPFSREICGGPHVKHTGELKTFKILKEEAVSAGVRRIKAILG
ncbi:MAG: alanine--tRNA ligase [Patescibacteria group bacterium]